MENNFTTIEHSNNLIESGLPSWTADCFFVKNDFICGCSDSNQKYYITIRQTGFEIENDLFFKLSDHLIPCWSVGRLIEIYNTCIDSDKDEIKIPKEHFVLQRVLIEFFAALENGWLDFTKLEK